MDVAPPTTLEQAIERIEKLAESVEGLTRENKILREQLQAFRMTRFGRSSERLEPGQLALFEQGEAPEDDAGEEAPPAPSGKKKRTKGHGRGIFPDHLPREEITVELPEDERCCGECGKDMQPFGHDVCERGHLIPARFLVRRYLKTKYACPEGHSVKTAKAPEGVIRKGKYEASVYSHVATAKYADHLPLNRLEGIFKRHGTKLSKQTMWDMLVTVDEQVAQPVLEEMRGQLLTEPVLHSDETPITMRIEDGKGTRTSYAWGWRNLRGVGESKVLIEFRPTRSRDGPLGFLGDWAGTLIADAYSGFDEVVRKNGIVRAGCLAHARRKVKEALDTGSKGAARLLRPIQRLFWIERAVTRRAETRELEREELVELRARVRDRRSRPIWERLGELVVCMANERGTLPKSKLGKAIGYLERQRDALSVFLTDPRIPIHNNDSERDLRHIAVGRKNWLVFASPKGGEVACRLYSLVLSCKQCGVDPEEYIEDVLLRTTTERDIASLTPWGWKAARQRAGHQA